MCRTKSRTNKINFTIADCEYIWDLWRERRYEDIENIVLELNPLEAMKLTKQLITYHDEFGEVVSGIINFITDEICRDAMLAKRDGTTEEYCKKYGIEQG